LEEILDFISSI